MSNLKLSFFIFVIGVIANIKASDPDQAKCGYVNGNGFQTVLGKCDIYSGTSTKSECSADGESIISHYYATNTECSGESSASEFDLTANGGIESHRCDGNDCKYMEFFRYEVSEDTKNMINCKKNDNVVIATGHYLQNYCFPTSSSKVQYYQFLCVDNDHINKTYYSDAVCLNQVSSEDFHVKAGCQYTDDGTGDITTSEYNEIICGKDQAYTQTLISVFTITVLIVFCC
eukprot:327129_1